MTISANQGSKVIVQEVNLSQVITSASTSVVAQVIVSTQGAPVPIEFTNAQDYLNYYGNPNAAVSFDIYCGLDYFKEGNALWGLRVVGAGALYAALLLYTDGTQTYLVPVTSGVTDPTEPDWDAITPSGAGNEALALFYPSKGQGSYGDNYAISILSSNLSQPTGVTATSSSTGGTLPAATYNYQVSALSASGETLASSTAEVVIAGPQVTNSVTITWPAQSLATGYNVYGRTTGNTYGLIKTVGQGTTSFIDTGAATPDTTKQPITSPADVTISPYFQVNVYDTSQSTQYFVEQFQCSLYEHTNASGVETELQQSINPFSQYIRVTSNVPNLVSVSELVTSAPLTNMTGGDSGAAPLSTDVAAAWNTFRNEQLYPINILLNSGHSTPDVQLAMDTLAQQRGDCVALLDMPSEEQQFQNAINYRNLQLNINSTYSAIFCPDVLEADTINGKQQYVPFSGWAAALCARTDRVANPSYSIAGLNRGLVDVLKTRYTYDQGQMDALFQAQINYTQTFIGQGIALWEQQTLSGQMSALSWLSVRRIVNVIKVALKRFLLYSIQEPNDDFLGRQIVTSCSTYLQAIKDNRGISDFKVVSDASNNSAQDFNSGIRNVSVVLIPLIPVHLINLQVIISKQGVSFKEALSQVAPG
jgi:phage tail sheath protein FI